MKRLLNTLFVTTQGAYLHREGETVEVKLEGERLLQLPILALESVVCFGRVLATPQLLAFCAERGVAVSFLSENGRFWASVHGPTTGNVLLRRAQYRAADDAVASAEIARAIVVAKIANGRAVLLRGARDYPDAPGAERLAEAARRMARVVAHLERPAPLDEVRGREGEAASAYFAAFDDLITAQKEAFAFAGRSLRPPLDPINALLSFLYTLLTADVRGALEGVGLDPAVGFLHRDRPGRPSLALDLMEEMRPLLADRLALSLVNRRQVSAKGFRKSESGAVEMTDETRKEVLVAWQKRKQEEIRHPFTGEKMAMGLVPHLQALLLARHLRGDLDAYPPFLWK